MALGGAAQAHERWLDRTCFFVSLCLGSAFYAANTEVR